MIELLITGLSNKGEGVGRFENKVHFVSNTVPGDLVLAEIYQSKKNFARARLKEILTPSPQRITPSCSHFGKCGGCDWQNLSTAVQRKWKIINLEQTLLRLAQFKPEQKLTMFGGKKDFFYRNRIRGFVKNGSFHFYKKGSSETVVISQCWLAEPAINQVLQEKNFNGLEGHVEIGVLDGNTYALPLQAHRSTTAGFRQVNSEMQQVMQTLVSQGVHTNSHYVLDLFCGAGAWTFSLAKQFPNIKVIGVDIDPNNIENAKKNTPLPNLDFILGDAKENWPESLGRQGTVIVDPPRAGLAPDMLKLLLKKKPMALIYISCDPATLARDLKFLLRAGFTIDSLSPVDMFPQTSHLETVVTMRY